ncbi:MAG: hypothetical protein ACE361_17975 [Aureliella sp.]
MTESDPKSDNFDAQVEATSSATDADDFEFGKSDAASISRHPMNIGFLFQVVSLGGIMAACLRSLVGEDAVTGESLTRLLAIGMTVGLFVGCFLGFYYFKSSGYGLVGSAAGVAVGAVAASLTLVRAEYFLEVASIAFAGSWILIVAMLAASRWRVEGD